MTNRYFKALDGLRVVAILLVVLTHFPLNWLPAMPGWAEPFLYFFTASGKIGVSILFVMTGFLMSWLHPNPTSAIDFYTRRLARIFPLFLVMVLSLTVIRANPAWPVLAQLGIILGLAGLARLLSRPLGRKLTLFWLGLMLVAALSYIFWLNRIPPAIYYQIWPAGWRVAITALANVAMALPFGQYIPQLDGVYWALILEVWFYLLYPILFVPLAHKFKPAMFPAALLFGFGLSLVADRTLGLKMLEPAFFIYFLVGVALGRNLNWWQKRIKPAPVLLLLILLSATQFYLTKWLPEFYYPWMRLLLAPLAGLAVLTATFKHRFLEAPWLTKLSRYTYAVFLTHSWVIDQIFRPGLLMVIVSLAATLGLSIVLYHVAERPYFISSRLTNIKAVAGAKKPLIALTLAMFLLLDWAFRPPFSFFSAFARHGERGKTISLGPEPLRFTFTATTDNLGMITSHLKSKTQLPTRLFIRLYDDNGRLLQETNYKAADIYENNYHPFGFIIQPDSAGREYFLEYQLDRPDLTVKLFAEEQQFISVYFNREISGRWLINKLIAPFTSRLYWLTLINLAPLLLMLYLNKEVRQNVEL